MSLSTITDAHRFAAIARERDLDRRYALWRFKGGACLTDVEHVERHAINHARYWESFADHYTPQQQRAAVRLLLVVSDLSIDPEGDEYVAAVRRVAALVGAERQPKS